MNRMHPVLGRRLPHYGVDYGAPAGTPVMATADGTVSFTGRKGGGGNTVEIRHAGGYVTAYLHLSRFAVRPGTRVEQGQVIGYVGSTGLSTGPHLDYRVTLGGRYVNPLMVGKEPSPPLPPTALPAFTRWAERVLPMLLTPGRPSAEAEASLRAGSPVRFDA
jgi:murein DD-endopeptidase MepM/ murein hydrolase activator NlpD